MLYAGAAGALQHMDKAQRVHLHGGHRVALAVRQGGNARNIVHHIELFPLEQSGQRLPVADVHFHHLAAEIMVGKAQIVQISVGKIVDSHNGVAPLPQTVPQLPADESGRAGH